MVSMPASIEALIVGAGPSGLFAAIELPGTLEILADAGVADRVLAESVHLGYARLFDAELGQVGETSFAGAGCQWEFQCSLPQWRTEQILADRGRGTRGHRGARCRGGIGQSAR